MIGAPSRQPALDRLVPPCGWDDGVVALLQADSDLTTLRSGRFKAESRIHRRLRAHQMGEPAPNIAKLPVLLKRPLVGRNFCGILTSAANLSVPKRRREVCRSRSNIAVCEGMNHALVRFVR